MAAGFIRAGIGRGDAVAISLQNGPEWPAVVPGAARIGAVCAPGQRPRDGASRDTSSVPELLEGLGAGRTDSGPAAIRSHEPCYLLMTSGSTGITKWVVHRHGNVRTCLAT